MKEGSSTEKDGRRNPASQPSATTRSRSRIDEIGLTNRQVWAATLGELARRGEVGRAELESWLRPAALIGRDGPTLIIGAPNAVTRDRIATRLLPAVRDALAATIGAPVGVAVEVMAVMGDAAAIGPSMHASDSVTPSPIPITRRLTSTRAGSLPASGRPRVATGHWRPRGTTRRSLRRWRR